MEEQRRYFAITPLSLTPRVLCIAEQPEDFSGGILSASTTVHRAQDGLELLRNQDFDVVLVSLPLADCACASNLLEELQRAQPGTPVVLRFPEAKATEVVRLLRLGAFHVYAHGDATSLLFLAAHSKWAQEAGPSPDEPETGPWARFLIGDSRPMQQVA